MAVPKRKTSPSKRGMRRSADALKAPTYVEDKNSGEMRRPHHIDLKTGMYRGRQVLTPKESCSSSRIQPELPGRVGTQGRPGKMTEVVFAHGLFFLSRIWPAALSRYVASTPLAGAMKGRRAG